MSIALAVEYDGSGFRGWQTQPGGGTVQDACRKPCSSLPGGRCGSSAPGGPMPACMRGQVVHFDTPLDRPMHSWVRGVNTFLPAAVAVRWAQPVADDFHARFFGLFPALSLSAAQSAASHGRLARAGGLVSSSARADSDAGGRRNCCSASTIFSAFRAAECQANSPMKTHAASRHPRLGELLVFDFEASAFLHHMVRNLVGSLVYVGQGKHPPEWMAELLADGRRSPSGGADLCRRRLCIWSAVSYPKAHWACRVARRELAATRRARIVECSVPAMKPGFRASRFAA
jgi:tRNA pseudouridine38-40 synthase